MEQQTTMNNQQVVRRISRLSLESSAEEFKKEHSCYDGDARDCESETEMKRSQEQQGRRRRKMRSWVRRMRERWDERAKGVEGECRVLVKPRGAAYGTICMDMNEVKACRELGLELPSDWTVEIPFGGGDSNGCGGSTSPIGNWKISSPGDQPGDMKARLKVWAQAVALASASSFSG